MLKSANKKKTLLAIGASCAAISILAAGTFALFTARTESNMTAVAGNVNVSITSMDMTNKTNINPGDNDPNISTEAASGTEHNFTYTVSNDGNKSIRTRQTIILTANDGNLDARYLKLYTGNNELATKTFVMEDGSEKSSYSSADTVKAVKYTFIGDVFDGKGKDIASGGDAEKESLSTVVKENSNGDVTQTYSYDFALLSEATNEYQNAEFKIDVIVEAMQYRNTETTDWENASVAKKTFSNVSMNVTPASDENKSNNYKN